MKIAKRFFCDNEIKYITKAESEIDYRFFETWTKKESYVKYTGNGLSTPFKSFNVTAPDISDNFYHTIY